MTTENNSNPTSSSSSGIPNKNRVSFSNTTFPPPKPSTSNNNTGTGTERSNSITSIGSNKSNASRRSTLPPSLSMAMLEEKNNSNNIDPNNRSPSSANSSNSDGGSDKKKNDSSSGNTKPQKRASISGGMLTSQFRTREGARWRPNTMKSQDGNTIEGNTNYNTNSDMTDEQEQEEIERIKREQLLKPIRQQIFDKTTSSLAIHLLIIILCYVVGVVTNMILRRDLGMVMFWGNQIAVTVSFLQLISPNFTVGLPSSLSTTLSQLTPFDQGTLACQVIPLLLFLIWDGIQLQTYATFVKIIILQACLKLALMLSSQQVVKVVL
jgi:hypothetical protein